MIRDNEMMKGLTILDSVSRDQPFFQLVDDLKYIYADMLQLLNEDHSRATLSIKNTLIDYVEGRHDDLMTSTQKKIGKLGDRVERDVGGDPVAVEVR